MEWSSCTQNRLKKIPSCRAITPNVRRLGSFGLSSAATAATSSNPFRQGIENHSYYSRIPIPALPAHGTACDVIPNFRTGGRDG